MSSEYISESRVEISPATADDLRPLVGIEEAVAMEKYPHPLLGITSDDIAAIGWGEERVAKYRERFLEKPDAALWVARENGQVIGFTAVSKGDDGYWVHKLYVASAYQRKGVGSALLTQAESWLGSDVAIQLGVAAYDHAALQFYAKHGYVPTGFRPEDQTTVHVTGKVIPEVLLLKRPTL